MMLSSHGANHIKENCFTHSCTSRQFFATSHISFVEQFSVISHVLKHAVFNELDEGSEILFLQTLKIFHQKLNLKRMSTINVRL